MKNLLLSSFLLTAGPFTLCAAADSGSPAVNVSINSECTELAAGYARAFTSLRKVPFHVQLQRGEGKTTLITDIKAVTAVGAVLLIETNKSLFYAVNPKDVMWISDAPVVVEKPVTATAR